MRNEAVWIGQTRLHYVAGTIEVDQFEADVWEALNGRPPIHAPWSPPESDLAFGPGAIIEVTGSAEVTQGPLDDWLPLPPPDDHCPRDESCVIAHPCRVCGADTGEACFARRHRRRPPAA